MAATRKARKLSIVIDPLDPFQMLVTGMILAVAALLPVLWVLRNRAKDALAAASRADQHAKRSQDLLSATPDGIFLWDNATGGISCSRRLADILELEAGTLARYDDIRACFEEAELQKLEQGVSLLRAKGTGFTCILRRGAQTLHVTGSRAAGKDADAVADIVWIRDASDLAGAAGAQPDRRNTSGLEDRHLTALLDTLPIPIWLRDADLQLAFLNTAAEKVRGLDPALADKARRQAAPETEVAPLTRDGEATNATVTETPLSATSADGLTGTIGFAVPAAHVPSVATAPVSFSELLRPLEAGVVVFSADTAIVSANTAFSDLWRIDPDWLDTRPTLSDLLIQLRDLRRLPEVTDFRDYRRRELALFDGLDRIAEEDLHLPDGRTVRRRVGPMPDGGLVMTYVDVSDRLSLQRSLKSADQVQRTTLENLREGIAVFGGDGRLKLINPQLPDIWGLDANDVAVDRRLADVIEALGMRLMADNEPWSTRKERIARDILSRTPSTGQVELITGQVMAFANIPLPDGGALVSYLDVTDTYRVEEALRERARSLAEADRMKTEFIANVALEVRTPLNTITGFADVLRREMYGQLNDRQHSYALGIHDTATQMMAVIGDILDLATIDAGRMELNLDSVDPHSVLLGAFDLVADAAKRKNIRTEFDCPPDIGWITSDAKRLSQVAYNLLSNAVVFTPKLGKVSLTVTRQDPWLEFVVSDSGPGIPQADRGRVFQPFARIDDDKHRSDGPGLGLTIVKRFVELHGGDVLIRSNKARGTSVVCRIPVDGENTEGLVPFATDHAIVEETAAE